MKAAAAHVATPATNDNAPDDVLDVAGAMALLKVGRDAVYAGCARQEIPHRKVGRHLRFSRVALMRWLDPRAETKGP